MSRHQSGITLGRARPVRILIAEDNPDDLCLFERALQSARGAEFEVRSVERFADAVQVIRSNWPDVLLLDLSLPDSQGVETARRARAEAPGLPIVVLTGIPHLELGDAPLNTDVQDYLVKDQTTPQVLLRALRYAIQSMDLATSLRQCEADFLALQSVLDVETFRLTRDGEVTFTVEPVDGIPQVIGPDVLGKLMARFSSGFEEGDRTVIRVSSGRSAHVLRCGPDELFVALMTTAFN